MRLSRPQRAFIIVGTDTDLDHHDVNRTCPTRLGKMCRIHERQKRGVEDFRKSHYGENQASRDLRVGYGLGRDRGQGHVDRYGMMVDGACLPRSVASGGEVGYEVTAMPDGMET